MSDLSFVGGNSGQNFVVTEDDYETTFQPIPAGEYAVRIIDLEERENSKGTGTFVEFKTKIITEGEQKGRDIRFYQTLKHDNPQVEEIATVEWKRLGAYCLPKGTALTNTKQFLGKNLMLKVSIRKYTNKDGEERAGNNARISGPYRKEPTQTVQPPVQHNVQSQHQNPWDN